MIEYDLLHCKNNKTIQDELTKNFTFMFKFL